MARSARRCTTRPSRRFAKACNGAICSGLPRHHCLQPPHVVEDSTVFYFSRAHGLLLDFFPSLWPGTASFKLLSFDATGKSLPPWRLALAQEAARGTFVFVFLLVFLDGGVLERILTACEEFIFKGC